MTDKQILIDGVDVAGCVRLQDDKISCDLGGECNGFENCYYKQLKRKEQECKNNKIAHQMELDIYNQECLNLQEELKAKEQECEELKERLESFQKDYSKLYQVVENKDYIKELDQLKTENEELIRRIAKIFACLIEANKTNKIVDTLWVNNITTLWDYIALTLGIEGDQVHIEEQILQKINKV